MIKNSDTGSKQNRENNDDVDKIRDCDTNVDDDGGDDVDDPNSDVLNDVKEGDYQGCD